MVMTHYITPLIPLHRSFHSFNISFRPTKRTLTFLLKSVYTQTTSPFYSWRTRGLWCLLAKTRGWKCQQGTWHVDEALLHPTWAKSYRYGFKPFSIHYPTCLFCPIHWSSLRIVIIQRVRGGAENVKKN